MLTWIREIYKENVASLRIRKKAGNVRFYIRKNSNIFNTWISENKTPLTPEMSRLQ